MLTFLNHLLVTAVVSYLSFTNMLGVHLNDFLNPTEQDDAYVALHATPLEPSQKEEDSLHTVSDLLRKNKNFQRAALSAANEPTEYTAPDTLETKELLREALVNVYCQYKTDTFVRTTTGTGFFINQKGIILTNAHVAQFLLLEEGSDAGNVSCIIRTGTPAKPMYKADLLYISPTWIFNNASLITEEQPRGTGERDYALLYVSDTVDETSLPSHFPALPLDTTLVPKSTEGETVIVGGYPAGALLRDGADAALLSVVAESTVGNLYTFGSHYADLFSVANSPVGEEGSSGGPIVNEKTGKAIGIIVTKGDTSEGEQSVRALTTSYLDRTMQEETGFSLIQNMQGDMTLRAKVFKSAIVPFLSGLLEKELQPEQ